MVSRETNCFRRETKKWFVVFSGNQEENPAIWEGAPTSIDIPVSSREFSMSWLRCPFHWPHDDTCGTCERAQGKRIFYGGRAEGGDPTPCLALNKYSLKEDQPTWMLRLILCLSCLVGFLLCFFLLCVVLVLDEIPKKLCVYKSDPLRSLPCASTIPKTSLRLSLSCTQTPRIMARENNPRTWHDSHEQSNCLDKEPGNLGTPGLCGNFEPLFVHSPPKSWGTKSVPRSCKKVLSPPGPLDVTHRQLSKCSSVPLAWLRLPRKKPRTFSPSSSMSKKHRGHLAALPSSASHFFWYTSWSFQEGALFRLVWGTRCPSNDHPCPGAHFHTYPSGPSLGEPTSHLESLSARHRVARNGKREFVSLMYFSRSSSVGYFVLNSWHSLHAQNTCKLKHWVLPPFCVFVCVCVLFWVGAPFCLVILLETKRRTSASFWDVQAHKKAEPAISNLRLRLAGLLPFTFYELVPKWVWLKIKQEGLRRFWSMFPLTRVPVWVPVFWATAKSWGLVLRNPKQNPRLSETIPGQSEIGFQGISAISFMVPEHSTGGSAKKQPACVWGLRKQPQFVGVCLLSLSFFGGGKAGSHLQKTKSTSAWRSPCPCRSLRPSSSLA